jgi:hypothetical protein
MPRRQITMVFRFWAGCINAYVKPAAIPVKWIKVKELLHATEALHLNRHILYFKIMEFAAI